MSPSPASPANIPQAGNEASRDDLGLTAEDWMDLQEAYNFGLIEPREGTVEAEAFRRMDAYARAEVDRVAASEKAEQAWREARPEEIEQAARNPEPEAAAEPF
jgi:hypothetical protein